MKANTNNRNSGASGLRSIIATLVITLTLSHVIRSEVPKGSIRGSVFLKDSGVRLQGAEIVLEPVSKGEAYRRRYVKTGKDGAFSLTNVTAGDYEISASSRAHRSEFQKLTVTEGKPAQVTMGMERSQEAFSLRQNQKVFGSDEVARIAVSGYVDSKAAGKDAVQLSVYKTRLSRVLQNSVTASALEKVGRSWDSAKKLPMELLLPASGERPAQVKKSDIPITEGDREGFFYKRVPFGKLANGLYLVDMKHGKDTLCAWVLITDTAVVTKKADRQLIAYTVDMRSGQPIADCEVRAYQQGRIAASGRTDKRGVVEMEAPRSAGGTSQELTTVALRGKDEAVVQLNDYQREDGGGFVVHAYTDRPIYRPGQKISFKGIARRRLPTSNAPGTYPLQTKTEDNTARYTVPTGQSVDIEIRDPSGERILKERTTSNSYGSFAGAVELSQEAPTGSYSLIMTVAGEQHTKDILISSYRKPEFEVTVTPEKKRYVRGEEVKVTVSGQYYFGSPVVGAQVEYNVYRAPDWSAEYPDDYGLESGEEQAPEYYHGDKHYGEVVAEGKATLDENGKAVLTFPATGKPEDDGPQQEIYSVSVTMKDSSDRYSYEDADIKIVPGDFRVTLSPIGYLAMPSQKTEVTVQTLDHDNHPVPNVSVELEAGYYEWKEGEYEYSSVQTQTVTTDAQGRVVAQVTPQRAGSLLLKARAKDRAGRKILGRAYLWVVDDAGGELATEYADLSLHTDKRKYLPGDTARVLLNSAKAGQSVLVTVEGERVYRTELVQMKHRSTVIRVPIRAEYGPNVFLSACYVLDKKFSQSEFPLRVTLPQREIKVRIRADREQNSASQIALARYEPRQRIRYEIETTDAQGKGVPSELSFGVVDEAIYALREDDPTALRDAFYPRRYNGVNTRYSFAVEYLGDADKSEPKIDARKKFLDTAYWDPALRTDSNGHATVSFELPDNLTTWRATATAHTLDTHLGRAIQKVIVTKDFFVRVVPPRFLTQRDQSQITVVVHNESGVDQQANVRFTADNLTISGEATRQVTVVSGRSEEIAFPVIADNPGQARLRVTAWTTSNGKQLTDGVELPLPIRPHGRELVAAMAGDVSGYKPVTEIVRYDPTAIPEASRLTIRITPSIISSLGGALDYLIGYPYGCTEQTLSRFLPTLLVQRTLRLNGSASVQNRAEIPKMVRSGLLRLYRFQHSEGENRYGGWGWWENDDDDPWMTAYVLYGLSVARAEGYVVSKNALDRGQRAALKMLQNLAEEAKKAEQGQLPNVKKEDIKAEWRGNERAFLLYALALLGSGEQARIERERLRLPRMESEGLAYLVLYDRLTSKNYGVAFAELEKRVDAETGMLHWRSNPRETGNDITTTAVALRAYIAVNPSDARMSQILRWLMLRRTGDYWYSTRDTSWTLAALTDYLAVSKEFTVGGEVQIKLNGAALESIPLNDDVLKEKEVVLRIPAKQLVRDRNEITLTRAGGTSPVFYSIEMRQTVASEDMPAMTTAQLAIKREYLRVLPKPVGASGWSVQTEATNNQLRVGDRIRVRLTLKVPHDMSYVLIEDPFPSGCEVTERGTADDVVEWNYWWSSIDLRDDRVAFFARNLRAGTHIIEYNLRAQTAGTFHTLPTLLQAMYAPEARAESPESRITIK